MCKHTFKDNLSVDRNTLQDNVILHCCYIVRMLSRFL